MEPHSSSRTQSRRFKQAILYLLQALVLALLFSLVAGAQGPSSPSAHPGEQATGSSIAINILIVLALTLLNGAFAMAETALISVRKSRIDQLIDEGSRAALVAKRLVDNPPRFIATTQVGITLLGFGSAAAAATTLSEPLIPLLIHLGLARGIATTLSIVVVTLVIAFMAMVLGEIAPKSIAVQAPDVWALRLAPFVNSCATVFAPLTWLVVRATDLLVRPFGAKAKFDTPVITEEELKQIIDAGEEAGELEEEEREMLHNVFSLGETQVRSVMTPRIDMTSLPILSNLDQILDAILTSGHSRLPVYDTTIDNIVGIVHAKDLLPIFKAEEHIVELRQVMRAPYFVPETKRVSDLLAEFRRATQQLAIVQDEYGGTAGIVTLEDLLEEIVGDIRDEYDVDEPEVHVISQTESLIDGRMSIDDVNDRLGTDLPHEDYTTIGGLVFGLLGHEAVPGQLVRVNDLELRVEQMEDRRIKRLRAVKVGENDRDGDKSTMGTTA